MSDTEALVGVFLEAERLFDNCLTDEEWAAAARAVLASDWLAGVKAEAWREGFIAYRDAIDGGYMSSTVVCPYATPEPANAVPETEPK